MSVFTTTHARTKRSNVMPGGGPYRSEGPDATLNESGLEERPLDGAEACDVPYFCSSRERSMGERLYPKLRRASESSAPSMDPDRSRSKCLKTFCQSWMYFHSPANSAWPIARQRRSAIGPWRRGDRKTGDSPLKPMVPLRSVS